MQKLFTFFLLSSFLIPLSATAQWVQKGVDLNGEAIYDESGRKVDMPDNRTIAIGAEWNDGSASNSGHVRVYRWSNLNARWYQRGQDLNGEALGDRSGTAISMSDVNTIAIGAPKNDANGTDAGHVRVYEFSRNNWAQKGLDLDGDTTLDSYGTAVSLSDANTLAVGAPGSDIGGYNKGLVRVYRWNGASWIQKGADLYGDANMAIMGIAVEMPDSNTLAVSGSSANGSVRTYIWNGSTWVQKGADIIGEGLQDRFGEAISMPDSNTIAIGARFNDKGLHNSFNFGHARVYKWANNAWTQVGADLDGEFTGDYFGAAVSMPDPYTVAVAGPYNDGGGRSSGHVKIFQWTGTAWVLKGTEIDGSTREQSGHSISMGDANTIGIGAPYYEASGTNSFEGRARVFTYSAITSLNEQDQPIKISFSPNPAKDQLIIQSEEANGLILQLLDISGRVLKEIQISSNREEVDLSQWSSGVYFLRHQGEVEKLVISR